MGEMFGKKLFTFGRIQIKFKLIFQCKLIIDNFVYDIDGQLQIPSTSINWSYINFYIKNL